MQNGTRDVARAAILFVTKIPDFGDDRGRLSPYARPIGVTLLAVGAGSGRHLRGVAHPGVPGHRQLHVRRQGSLVRGSPSGARRSGRSSSQRSGSGSPRASGTSAPTRGRSASSSACSRSSSASSRSSASTTFEEEFVPMFLAFVIFFYLNYPGVQKQFVEHEMSLLTPEQTSGDGADRRPPTRPRLEPWPRRPPRPLRRADHPAAAPPAAPPSAPGDPPRNALTRPVGRVTAIRSTRPIRASGSVSSCHGRGAIGLGPLDGSPSELERGGDGQTRRRRRAR